MEWISVKDRLPEAKPFSYSVLISKPVAVIHADRPDYPLIAHATFTDSELQAGAGIAIATNGASPFKYVEWRSAAVVDLSNPFNRKDADYSHFLPRIFGMKITHWSGLPDLPSPTDRGTTESGKHRER